MLGATFLPCWQNMPKTQCIESYKLNLEGPSASALPQRRPKLWSAESRKERISTDMQTVSHKPVENGCKKSSQVKSSCDNFRMNTQYLEVKVILISLLVLILRYQHKVKTKLLTINLSTNSNKLQVTNDKFIAVYTYFNSHKLWGYSAKGSSKLHHDLG